MQYGIILTTGDPRTAADLAAEAEAAGWDGVFTYDALSIGDGDLYDPWVTLAAMAMRTERVRLGALVFAPTRRPWLFAKEAATLDVLSKGWLVLPVGLGALDDKGFGNVGEPTDAFTRARLLDETLAIVDGLGSGGDRPMQTANAAGRPGDGPRRRRPRAAPRRAPVPPRRAPVTPLCVTGAMDERGSCPEPRGSIVEPSVSIPVVTHVGVAGTVPRGE